MKQHWGSARANGRVSFNWRIIMAPKRLLEYVVAHELCHLKHPNHSRDFWRLLERTMPDHERRRVELAIVGPKFDLARISSEKASDERRE
jgi:predicted metal-dependent hydrolase